MIFTLPFAKACFDRFNREFFNGELPEIPIRLGRAKRSLGTCSCRIRRRWWHIVRYDFRLRFSTSFDLPEAELEDTVLHEMIHYWIWLNDIRDTSAHGKIFRQQMARVNAAGRHVTISHRTTCSCVRPD